MPNADQIDLILDKIGLTLSPEQQQVIHCPNREILVAGGERGGKSRISAAFLTTRFPYGSSDCLTLEK